MKQQTIWAVVRKCLPEFVIGVAVCGGGMMLLVDPLHSRLADAQQHQAELEVRLARQSRMAGDDIDLANPGGFQGLKAGPAPLHHQNIKLFARPFDPFRVCFQ